MLVKFMPVWRLADLKLPKDSNARIVGQELHGCILICCDATDAKGHDTTAVYLSDPRDDGLPTLLYVHPQRIDIVGATVNRERSLLAFTLWQKVAREPRGVYESHIAELGEKGRVASLNTQRSLFQRVQFLYGEGGRSCFLALFLLNEFVSLYQIPVTVTQGRMYISGKIQPLQSIQRKVLWFSWDMQRQRIYMLYPHPNNLSELMFKSVQFTERGMYDLKWDIHLKIRMPSVRPQESPPEFLHYLQCGRSLPDAELNIEVVDMGNSVTCICVQVTSATEPVHPGGPPALRFTIFPLHQRCRLSFCVPLPGVDEATVRRMRVFFSTACGYVLCYVPGHLLQLVDCGGQHAPSPGFQLIGSAVPLLDNHQNPCAYTPTQSSSSSSSSSSSNPTASSPSTTTPTTPSPSISIPSSSASPSQCPGMATTPSSSAPPAITTYFGDASAWLNCAARRQMNINGISSSDPFLTSSSSSSSSATSSSSSSTFGHALFDERTSTAFTCELCMSAIHSMLGTPAHSVRGLHVLIHHVRDQQLVRQAARSLLVEQPDLITTEWINEYLVGMTYLHLQMQSVESAFLRLVPNTTMLTYAEEQQMHDIIRSADGCTFAWLPESEGVDLNNKKSAVAAARSPRVGSWHAMRQRVYVPVTTSQPLLPAPSLLNFAPGDRNLPTSRRLLLVRRPAPSDQPIPLSHNHHHHHHHPHLGHVAALLPNRSANTDSDSTALQLQHQQQQQQQHYHHQQGSQPSPPPAFAARLLVPGDPNAIEVSRIQHVQQPYRTSGIAGSSVTPSPGGPLSAQPLSSSESTMGFTRKLFSRVFGSSAQEEQTQQLRDQQQQMLADQPDSESMSDADAKTRQALIEALAKYYAQFVTTKEQRSRCNRWAREYFAKASVQADQLLTTIFQTRGYGEAGATTAPGNDHFVDAPSSFNDMPQFTPQQQQQQQIQPQTHTQTSRLSSSSEDMSLRTTASSSTIATSSTAAPSSTDDSMPPNGSGPQTSSSFNRQRTVSSRSVAAVHNNKHIVFSLLERFYSAMELQRLPVPSSFLVPFATLGYECLGRTAFLQYASRGIVRISSSVLLKVWTLLENPESVFDPRVRVSSVTSGSAAATNESALNASTSTSAATVTPPMNSGTATNLTVVGTGATGGVVTAVTTTAEKQSAYDDEMAFRFALASHAPATAALIAVRSLVDRETQRYVSERYCRELLRGRETAFDAAGSEDRFFNQFHEDASSDEEEYNEMVSTTEEQQQLKADRSSLSASAVALSSDEDDLDEFEGGLAELTPTARSPRRISTSNTRDWVAFRRRQSRHRLRPSSSSSTTNSTRDSESSNATFMPLGVFVRTLYRNHERDARAAYVKKTYLARTSKKSVI